MSRRHSPGAFYGISVVRASPFWSGQAGPRGPERLHSGLSREASHSLLPRLPIGGSGHWRPEARALHDGSGGAVSEAVQRAVGEDGLLEEGHPFVRRAVTRIATLLKSSRTRARSKLTGSHTICSKVAASSKPACSSRCSPRKKSWRTQGIRRSTFGSRRRPEPQLAPREAMRRAVGNLHALSGQPALDLSPLGRQPLSERRGRPMWGGRIAAMIAATWASVGSAQPGHRPAATQAAMYLKRRGTSRTSIIRSSR
jgi:hypothetical protein